MRLVECVPNFSEGRDEAVIRSIAAGIAGTEGVRLLDVDPGRATNRTVMTFVGPPPSVEEAAFRAIRIASELIDMTRHHGEHPRMGATDVCPFVPMAGSTMAECVEIARRLGRRVGEELSIPVYLYEHAAFTPVPRPLSEVRKGEYEGLASRPDPPDFGPGGVNRRSGATAIGAREFLIAYNINLNTRDRRLANRIAGALRESGLPKRDADGRPVRDGDGKAERIPGRFRELRGVGWYIEEYGRAQLSFNLTNFRVTPVHAVFDAAGEEAARLGLRVTGSELVGLIPREALLAAGDHYLTLQGKTTGLPESERIHTAVLSLGLDELGPFDPVGKVVEYRYRGIHDGLTSLPVTAFVDELSSPSPAPGGGSVAALCGALSASLSSMVAAITFAKREALRPQLRAIGRDAQSLKDWFVEAVERDTTAFEHVLEAMRMPHRTKAEQEARADAIRAAYLEATTVPHEVLERSVEALELAAGLAREGIFSAISDIGVAGRSALAAAEGAALNVRVNVGSIGEGEQAEQLITSSRELIGRARSLAGRIEAAVGTRLSGDQ